MNMNEINPDAFQFHMLGRLWARLDGPTISTWYLPGCYGEADAAGRRRIYFPAPTMSAP